MAGRNTYIISKNGLSHDINEYVHFMSITKEMGEDEKIQYVLHNDFTQNGKTEADSLKEVIANYSSGDGEAICIVGVEK